MKILILLFLLPLTLWGNVSKKITSSFNVIRPITLVHKKKFETIDRGVYRIILQQMENHLTMWFEQLDKEFKFKVPKGMTLSENYTLPAKISGQPFTLVVYSKNKKKKIRDYVEEGETPCKLENKVKLDEECTPKIEWVPFEYRKIAKKKGKMFCYQKPELAVRWGTRRDKFSVAVFGRMVNIDLVDSRKSEIVASAQYRNEELQKKVWKKGQCR